MERRESGTKTLSSVQRVMRVIQALNELEEASVSELASHLGYSSSSVHEHLNTLNNEGYVIKTANGYQLSLEFVSLAANIRSQRDRRNIKFYVENLANEVGMIVSYVVEESGDGVFLYRNSGGQNIETAKLGRRVDLHATAAGKAILAQLPERRVDEILSDSGLPKHTETTITSRNDLLEELEEIREKRYAINKGERINTLRSIATHISDENGDVMGALAITGPRQEVEDRGGIEGLSSKLLAKVEEIDLKTVYSGSV